VVLLSSLVPLALGLFQLVTNTGDHFTPGYNRIFATFAHPSIYAFYLLTILPVALAFIFYSSRGWPKVGACVLVALIPVGVIMTFTRDAWVGMLVTVLVIAAAKKPAIFFPVLIMLVGAYLFSPTIQARLSDVGSDSSTFAWRLDQWQEAIGLMAPWQLPFGIGSGGVKILTGEAAHNDYVRVLSEWGILGSLAFLTLYAAVLKNAFAAYKETTTVFQRELALAFIALVIARLVMFFTDNIFVNPVLEWYFWALAAMVISLRRFPAEEATEADTVSSDRRHQTMAPSRVV
jgi:O-antigen ligase